MDKIYSDALRLILLRPRTQKEVLDALVRKGHERDSAEEAVSYYADMGYINHEDYARRFSRDAARFRGLGPTRIRYELKNRGVEEDIINTALEEIEFDVSAEMIKKYGEGKTVDYKTAQKIKNYFYNKGFRADDINSTFKTLFTVKEEFND